MNSSPARRIDWSSSRRSLPVDLLLNIPAWITFSSIFNLNLKQQWQDIVALVMQKKQVYLWHKNYRFKTSYLAAAKIRSSTEFTVISLRTLTSFFFPILCARSWACRSWWGFQSESKMTTVSAVWRLSPKPPARVDNKKMKYSEFAMLKIFNISPRSSLFVMPSNLEINDELKC